MDEPKKTDLACALAVWDDKKLLILGRTKWISEGTPWIMPGGGFDSDKDISEKDTAIREFFEETGVELDNVVRNHIRVFRNYKTEWTNSFIVHELMNQFSERYIAGSIILDYTKFFGYIWLDTDNKSMLNLFWPQLMPGLRMYLKDKLGADNAPNL